MLPPPRSPHAASAPQVARSEPKGGRAPAASGDDWISPFEDELDVPTFLRRRGTEEDDEERESPAFLRRSAD